MSGHRRGHSGVFGDRSGQSDVATSRPPPPVFPSAVVRPLVSDSASASDGSSSAARWLLLEGNRLAIAAGVVACVTLATLAVLWAFGYAAVRPQSPINFVYSSMITGNLTLLTVVLSINQLVLSRELGAPGTLSQRIDATLEYRTEVEETTDTSVTPKAPSAFIRHLHESVGETVDGLAGTTDELDGETRRRLESVLDSLRRDVRTVNGALEGDDVSIFGVVGATISTNHAEQLNEIAEMRANAGESLSDEQREALDRIEDALFQIDVARDYFKTIYVQKELAYLSRVLLYVGVPAIVSGALSLLAYNAGHVGSVPSELYAVVIVVTVTLGFAPLAILFAFVLRLAWVAQQTATIAPFSPDADYRP